MDTSPSLGALADAVQEQMKQEQSPQERIVPITTARPQASEQSQPPERWNPLLRIAFRFVFAYFLVYFLPFPLTLVPRLAMPAYQYSDVAVLAPLRWLGQGSGWLIGRYEAGVQAMVFWVGENILGLADGAIIAQRTGSGDTMLRFVEAFCYLAIAVLATLIWSAADFRRGAYRRLHAWFHIFMAYALASWLLSYGFAKVPPMQFQPPGPERLLQPYGQSSPMGLLWTFMGASPAYTVFAGLAEIIPGVLLLFRRTRTLGAMMAFAVMLNVVLLNFCYDVPVKLFSSHLLIAALVLLAPDSRRVLGVLVLNRLVEPAKLAVQWPRRWMRPAAISIKAIVILVLLGGGVWGSVISWEQRGWTKNLPPLYGVYEVESFKSGGEELPPLLTDKSRWRRLVVTRWGGAMIYGLDDRRQFYSLEHDSEAGTLKLTGGPRDKPTVFGDFKLTQSESGLMALEGEMHGKPVTIALQKAKDDAFLLTSRGFHWIQEMPFNR